MLMSRVALLLFIVASLVSGACGGTPPSTTAKPQPTATGPGPESTKQIVIGILREPVSLVTDITGGNVSGGGAEQVQYIAHDFLTVQDDHGEWTPRLAAEPLEVEAGTWRVNPDGTMDTIWKLRPNVQWQDGAPFTSDDMLFSFEVFKDPDIPSPSTQAIALMTSAEAPDPLTYIVHWSGAYIRANQAVGMIPLPRHLLERPFREDKANFAASTHFTTDFVGLGAFQ